MGSAIECFNDAGAVVVPRSRFAPVKTCSDLFALRSDAYKVRSIVGAGAWAAWELVAARGGSCGLPNKVVRLEASDGHEHRESF